MANWVLPDPHVFTGVLGFRATILLQMAMWPRTSAQVPLQVSLCLHVSVIGCCLPVSPRVIPRSTSVYPGTVGLRVCVAVFIAGARCRLCVVVSPWHVSVQRNVFSGRLTVVGKVLSVWLPVHVHLCQQMGRCLGLRVSPPPWHFACWACPCDHQCVSHHKGPSPWPPLAFWQPVKCPLWRPG